MKFFGSILLFNYFYTAHAADEFYLRSPNQKKEILMLSQLHSMKVNEACRTNKYDCLLQIKNGLKNEEKTKPDNVQAGNPASLFCHRLGGVSLIAEDKEKNEYDICKLSGKYLIDSWDLYKKYKQ